MPKKKLQPVRRVIGTYEGDPIVGSKIKLTGGGTGLNDALTLDGRRFQRNEEIAVLVRGRIKNVGYGDANTPDELEDCIEIGTLDIRDGMVVNESVAEGMIREENERVALIKSRLEGAQASLLDTELREEEARLEAEE